MVSLLLQQQQRCLKTKNTAGCVRDGARRGGAQRMEGQERREETETSKAGHTVNALDTDTEEKGAYRGVGGGGGGGSDSGE